MDRRRFLQGVALTAASASVAAQTTGKEGKSGFDNSAAWAALPQASSLNMDGHTRVCEFRRPDGTSAAGTWVVYEDLRTRDGVMTFLSPAGTALLLTRRVEANFAGQEPLYLGLKLSDIGLSGADLLADALLAHGTDPDPDQVRSVAPPIGCTVGPDDWPPFNTFLGTVECLDTLPVFPSGSTLTYHPSQHFPELKQALALKRHEGLTGGWMPCPRKVMPAKDGGYYEASLFGEVTGASVGTIQFIVQTWHRTVLVRDGRIVKAAYGHSYPAYGPARKDPSAEEFFSALLDFALYWEIRMSDAVAMTLPDQSFVDMSRHALVKELMVRPGGVYPKYGAVERAYYGSEYDGFQDIFTSSIYTNLEWGRFEMPAAVFDNYYSEFVDERGAINMRGPETGQYGLMLSLVAMYLRYTGDAALVRKHRAKIEAIAGILMTLHDESLKLAQDDVGYGMIHGWNESDACLSSTPDVWWKPYFANSALAARGFTDIAETWQQLGDGNAELVTDWSRRSEMLREAVLLSVKKNVHTDMKPAYIGPLPGMKLTFWESMKTEKPSEQQWASGRRLPGERAACLPCASLARATYRYKSCLDPRTELRMRIHEIAQARVRYRYRRIRVLLNREGWDGQVSGVPAAQRRGLDAETHEACQQAQCCATARREAQAKRTGSGLEYKKARPFKCCATLTHPTAQKIAWHSTALEQMLFDKEERRRRKMEGTPGHLNQPLGLHTAS